jgi:hypothetical protein
MKMPLRSLLVVFFVFLCGFFAKALVAEAERDLSIHYVDSCLSLYGAPTPEQKTMCYGSAKDHLPYLFVSALNFQPSFWKNTSGRCVGTKGTEAHKYFECRWWNEIAL